MRFLVDAHLPPGQCRLLLAAGHDAIHTSQLPGQNSTPDAIISDFSLLEQRVVVTKDADFFHAHLLHGKPWKLVLVRTGNIRTRELTALFQVHLAEIVAALEQNSLVELDRQKLQVVV
jgi:predicted nuclease of predicted toxin-antitoxin system